jgi:hypothetical protein
MCFTFVFAILLVESVQGCPQVSWPIRGKLVARHRSFTHAD